MKKKYTKLAVKKNKDNTTSVITENGTVLVRSFKKTGDKIVETTKAVRKERDTSLDEFHKVMAEAKKISAEGKLAEAKAKKTLAEMNTPTVEPKKTNSTEPKIANDKNTYFDITDQSLA